MAVSSFIYYTLRLRILRDGDALYLRGVEQRVDVVLVCLLAGELVVPS